MRSALVNWRQGGTTGLAQPALPALFLAWVSTPGGAELQLLSTADAAPGPDVPWQRIESWLPAQELPRPLWG